MSEAAQAESPEARLKAAGFTQRLGFWVTPIGDRVLSLDDAIAGLASGEIEPGGPTMSLPDSGTSALPDELVERMFPKPSPDPPAWLLAQAEVVAQATAAKMKPLIRREVRAALRSKGAKS
jgi:hypothetical protein